LILAFVPGTALVFLSETLHGLTAGIITPCIAAISLGLVGRRAMSLRTGRNFRYAAAGHAVTAGLLGAAGTYFSPRHFRHGGGPVAAMASPSRSSPSSPAAQRRCCGYSNPRPNPRNTRISACP